MLYNMPWRLLLLVVWLPVLETELVQIPSFVKVNVGQSVNFTCIIEGAATSCYEIVWYIQRHTEAPQRIDTVDTKRRFSAAVGALKKECKLAMNNATKSDSGTYYCSRCSYAYSLFGQGTKLIVSEIDAKPSVFILPPSPDEIATRKNITIICLVYDPPHDNVSISWNVSGILMEGHQGSGMISATGDYSISSQLTMPIESWEKNPSIICALGEERKEYQHTSEIKDPPLIGEKIIYFCLGAMILLLVTILVTIIVCYQKKLKQASLIEYDSIEWENRVTSNHPTVIYQTVRGSGGAEKGKMKKKIKRKQEKQGEQTEDVHYACLELQSQ